MIWDPFQAAAEVATQARTLADGTDVVANHQFYLASRKFAEADAESYRRRARRSLPRSMPGRRATSGLWPSSSARRSAYRCRCWNWRSKRQSYGIRPINRAVIAEQQRIADTFFELKLLPKKINISDRNVESPAHEHRAGAFSRQHSLVSADPRRRPLSRHHQRAAATSIWPTCARSRRPPISSVTSACCCRLGAVAKTPGSSPRRWRR